MKKDLYNKIFAPSNCLSQQLMIGYLKGTLNEHQTHKVEEHLVDCELCSEALDGLMLVNSESLLGAVSDDVKRVVHKEENKRRAAPIGIWLAAAASFAIIIASVFTIKTIMNENNKQLAVHNVKIPVKDSLKSKEASSEENKAIITEISKSTTDELVVEKELQETRQIRTFNSPAAPAEPQLNSEMSSLESDQELIVAREENSESDIVFSDKKSDDLTLSGNPSLKSNSSTEPAAGSLSEIKTITRNTSVTEKSIVLNSEQIVYVQDLKIIDYSKQKEENILEPPANNTEAKYATPEVRQEVATAPVDESISYKEMISPALEAYQAGKYSVAISILNNILKENSSDLNAKFYSGMANYHLQKYSKSLDYLQPLIKKNDNTFFEEAKYYAALNYIELNEGSKARKLLIEIISMNGFYKQRADEKLKELN